MHYEGLSKLSGGIYLLCTAGEQGKNAMLASAVMQAAEQVICVSVNKESHTHTLLEQTGKFTLASVTTQAPLPFLEGFGFRSGRETDKFQGVQAKEVEGIPTVVEHCNAVTACRLDRAVDCGSHVVYFGHILTTALLAPAPSMTLDYYQDVVHGRIPPKSPAYAARHVKE